MGKYFDFALTEEQIAAYLDGMLNAEQSNMVEQMISSDFDMQQIEEIIDVVDSSFIAIDSNEVIPFECFADDFILPEITAPDVIAQSHDDITHGYISDDNDDESGFSIHDDHIHDDMDSSYDDGIYDDPYDDAIF